MVVFCSFPSVTEAADYENIEWVLKDDGELIISGSGEIANQKFVNNDQIKSVCISEGIAEIDNYAFENCKNLTSIKLPDSLIKIGTGAFRDCAALTEITLPDQVTELGAEVFLGTGIRELTIPHNVNYANRSLYGALNLEKVTFANGIKSIPQGVLEDSESVKTVVIPESVTEIKNYAFENCKNLTSIKLPDNLIKIGTGAFKDCAALTEITLPDQVTELGQNVFDGTNTKVYCNNKYSYIYLKLLCSGYDVLYKNAVRLKGSVLAENNSFTATGSGEYGYISMQVSYELRQLNKGFVYVKLPEQLSFIDREGGALFDGKKTAYTYDSNKGLLCVPVNKKRGTITFCVNVDGSVDETYNAFAVFSKEKTTNWARVKIDGSELIDSYRDNPDAITLAIDYDKKNHTITASGYTAPQKKVDIYINNKKIKEATANHGGKYEASFAVKGEKVGSNTILAKVSGADYGASVVYNTKLNIPKAEEFNIYYSQNESEMFKWDVLNDKRKTIIINPSYPFLFEVKLDKSSDVKQLDIVGIKDGFSNSIKLEYNEKLDKYIAEGWFDANNKNWIPNNISVRYTLKGGEKEQLDITDIPGIDVRSELVDKGKDYIKFNVILDDENKTEVHATMRGECVTTEQCSTPEELVEYLKTLGMTEKNLNYESITKEGKNYLVMQWYNGQRSYIALIELQGKQAENNRLNTTELKYISEKQIFDMVKSSAGFDTQEGTDARNLVTIAGLDYDVSAGYVVSELDGFFDSYSNATTQEEREELINQRLELTGLQLLKAEIFPKWTKFKAGLDILKDHLGKKFSENTKSEEVADFRGTVPGTNSSVKAGIDPSGIIYETIEDNPLSDVKVTIYYREKAGAKEKLWNASEYEQENPIITDRSGMYAWMVPEGQWQVRASKAGYKDARSEWLDVPPPQLGINLALVSYANPKIESIVGSSDGIKIIFDKYLDYRTISKKYITITDGNGKKLDYKLKCALVKNKNNGEKYTKCITLKGNYQKYIGKKLKITFNNKIKSYSGAKIKQKPVKCKILLNPALKVSSKKLKLELGYKKKIVVKSNDPNLQNAIIECSLLTDGMITVKKSTVKMKKGKAEFTLSANNVGTNKVKFNVKGTGISTIIPVTVVNGK